MKFTRFKEFYCALVLIIVCGQSAATSFPGIPATIKDYLETSDVVVTGRIGRIIKVHSFYGYQEGAEKLAELDKTSPIPLGLPMIDYEVIVDEVLETDGYYRGKGGSPLILRVVRDHAAVISGEGVDEDEGEFLFFLSRNPDDETYGFYTFAHKISLKGERPKYYFEGSMYEILPRSSGSGDFVTSVIQEINR